MTKSLGIATALVLGSMTFAGCGNSGHQAAASTPAQSKPVVGTSAAPTTSTPSPTTTPSTSVGSTPSSVSSQGSTPPPSPVRTGGVSTPSSSTPAPSPSHTQSALAAQALVHQWAAAASNGQAVGFPVADRQSYYQLEKAWGQGTHVADVQGIPYVSYSARHAVVGYNGGVQVVDERSYAADLHQITLADIEAVLGKPQAVRHTPGSQIYVYQKGAYQLLWVFTVNASGTVSGGVDHVDVQWPKGMVSPMSQANAPSPSQALVRQWAAAASNGQAVGFPVADRQSYYQLEKAWGQGTHVADVQGIPYVSYSAHHAVVGYNGGVQVVDERSYAADLHQITLADIEAVLGKPEAVRHTPGSQIYVYQKGAYQLLWVFTENASGTVSGGVDHVDVQWPKGMVSPMSQANAPASS